ncbi:hypothetical protein [Salinivibrio sp. MA607]|uniref:hypothetical protein n=1 Tax=Salinivibrio sp. MA607 TaxID=1909457 RepID=UPI000988CC9D|nr:hypothetical protein [Salinivibrio sp. MA607]OOF01923.1 hypothetical protein BZG81_15290 [Salinivibrio sp. MA607]
MLEAFVKLYRTIDSPSLQDGGQLQFDCVLDSQTLKLLWNVKESGIEIEEIEHGDDVVSLEEVATADGTSASVHLSIPMSGDYNVFRDLDDLLERAIELVNGKIASDFYVCDDNYWHHESEASEATDTEDVYTNLQRYCELVGSLEKLASYHDKKQNSTNHELVFISSDETTTSKPVVLRPCITRELLELPIIDISTITDLTSDKSEKQANINRERAIFKVSIIEFFENLSLNHSVSNFNHLIRSWKDFITLYNNNFETYMSGFAFHKAKKEVADVELKVAEQYSKVLGDIAGKLFGLPVSFAALLGFFAEKATFISDTLIIFGIVSATWLMTRLVANQIAQLQRISHAKDISFGSIQGKETQYPQALINEIKSAKDAIDLNANKLERDLKYLAALVWAPLSIGASLFICRHHDKLLPVIEFLKNSWST